MEGGSLWGAAYVEPVDAPTVEDILEKGVRLAEASPVHIAFRGTADRDSVRCAWRGIARTTQQREEAIRFWLGIEKGDLVPPPAEIENMFSYTLEALGPAFPATARSNFSAIARGGLTSEYSFLTCYADYYVQEYVLGIGPDKLTVAYDSWGDARSYELYRSSHAAGEFGDEPLQEEEEYERRLQATVHASETIIADLIGGRESVVFLAPMGAHNAIAFEAWQAVAQWDLQVEDEMSLEAVRYATPRHDSEYRQTLDSLRDRIEGAGTSDAFAGNRIENTAGLREYYESIGAYDVIGPYNIPRSERTSFVPEAPPPPYEITIEEETPENSATPAEHVAPTFVSISSGADLTCGLAKDGKAVCWGGEIYTRTSPPSEYRFLSVSSGNDYACGTLPDGSIGCWGNNYRGASSPPQGNFTAIESGRDHACALRGGWQRRVLGSGLLG